MRIYAALEGLCIAVLVISHSSLGKGIEVANCTYPVLKNPIINKTSGSDKVLRCSRCRECGLGKEPEIQCGTTLGIYEGHGNCKDCDEGMYSDADDTNACKMCRYRLCFEHQLYEGTCTKEKDESHCIPKCEAGYVINKELTKCEVDVSEIQNHTNMPNITLPPTNMPNITLPPSTKPADDQKHKKNEHPVTVIVGVVIAVVIGIILFAVVVAIVCYRLKILEPNQEDVTEESDPDNNDEPVPPVKYSEQEVFSEVNGSFEVIIFPSKETTCESEQTLNESDSASNSSATTPLVHPPKPNTSSLGTNNGCYNSNTPPGNCPLGVDPHVIPPTHVVQNRLDEPLSPPTLHAVRFERLPAAIYDKICLKFNGGPAGKNWRNLAGWMGLNCEDVDRIKLEANKTDHVIRRWAVATENTVNRFVEILEENEMTCLAHEIRAELI